MSVIPYSNAMSVHIWSLEAATLMAEVSGSSFFCALRHMHVCTCIIAHHVKQADSSLVRNTNQALTNDAPCLLREVTQAGIMQCWEQT